jgi:hypothetical protein
MADFSNAKKQTSSTYPAQAVDGSSFKRVEPLVTPAQIRSRFLRGIPLVSPITGEVLRDDQIQDDILQAANLVELDAKIDILPIEHKARLPFQREDYDAYIYTQLPNKPVLSVENMSIVTANNQTIYTIPPEWIETGMYNHGRLNVIPLSPASGGSGSALILGAGNSVGAFLLFLGTQAYIPAYWQVTYTTGFRIDQGLPMIINRLVGLRAAMMILENLIPQVQFSSHALGLDGVSQSQSNQAAQLYQIILERHQKEYDDILGRVEILFNNRLIAGNLS